MHRTTYYPLYIHPQCHIEYLGRDADLYVYELYLTDRNDGKLMVALVQCHNRITKGEPNMLNLIRISPYDGRDVANVRPMTDDDREVVKRNRGRGFGDNHTHSGGADTLPSQRPFSMAGVVYPND